MVDTPRKLTSTSVFHQKITQLINHQYVFPAKIQELSYHVVIANPNVFLIMIINLRLAQSVIKPKIILRNIEAPRKTLKNNN